MTDAMFDAELQEVMGKCRCTDATHEEPAKIEEVRARPMGRTAKVESPFAPTLAERAKACAHSLVPLLVAQGAIFIWQYSDMLADSAAIPALYVLGILSGVSVGKYYVK